MSEKDYITSALLEPFLSHIQERNLPAETITTKVRTLLNSPQVSTADFAEIIYAIHKLEPLPALGFRLGMSTDQKNFGFVGYLVFSCSNLRQALVRYRRFKTLLNTGVKASVTDKKDSWEVRWTQRVPNTPLGNEFSVAVFIRLYQSLIGKNIPPLRVGLPTAESSDPSIFEAIAGCPVEIGSDSLMVELPKSILSMKVASSDPHLLKLLEQQAAARLEQTGTTEDGFYVFFETLQDEIISAMKEGDASAEVVAETMGYSLRTFYRKLSDNGYNYRSILSEIRLRLAKQYLSDSSLSHSEIALLLGYSEQSSFIRAFRSWTGRTPGDYRHHLLS